MAFSNIIDSLKEKLEPVKEKTISINDKINNKKGYITGAALTLGTAVADAGLTYYALRTGDFEEINFLIEPAVEQWGPEGVVYHRTGALMGGFSLVGYYKQVFPLYFFSAVQGAATIHNIFEII